LKYNELLDDELEISNIRIGLVSQSGSTDRYKELINKINRELDLEEKLVDLIDEIDNKSINDIIKESLEMTNKNRAR
jgi:hypothetical protein